MFGYPSHVWGFSVQVAEDGCFTNSLIGGVGKRRPSSAAGATSVHGEAVGRPVQDHRYLRPRPTPSVRMMTPRDPGHPLEGRTKSE
jgi:hypothetical protein